MTTRPLAAILAVLGLGLVAGCATGQEGDVERTAGQFYSALQAKDGAAACELLSNRTRSEVEKSAQKPCAKAILEESIPKVGAVRKVQAFGTMSQVTYAGEAAFLSRFGNGWRVVAAGCKPKTGEPYDCEVQGG